MFFLNKGQQGNSEDDFAVNAIADSKNAVLLTKATADQQKTWTGFPARQLQISHFVYFRLVYVVEQVLENPHCQLPCSEQPNCQVES